MKIIFLNAWRATVREPLIDFLKWHAADTDVFCFQEAEAPFADLAREILTGYTVVTAHKKVSESDDFYPATYVRKTLPVDASGAVFDDEDQVGLGVYVQVALEGGRLTICNLHGMSRPIDKRDTPGRWRQTEGMVEFCKDKGPCVVGGDFNVFPSNESLQVFQKSGYSDLIHEYGVTNTRNHYVWDRYPDNPRQYYSDYVFVTPEVQVNSFTVSDAEVSDHLPLLLDLSMKNSLLEDHTDNYSLAAGAAV